MGALFSGLLFLGASQASAASLEDENAKSVELAPIAVIARARSEIETKVPISLAVVSGDLLESEGRFTLGQLDSRVANLQLADLNGTPAVFMRGVGGGGRQVAFEPRTGIYIDGVFMNVPPLTDALMLDLERVEVLRGPQGSLLGQNSVSGAINLVTREPGDVFSVESLARLDDNGQQRLGVAVDAPLSEDTLLLRVSGTLARGRGETVNLLNGDRLDRYNQAGARMRLQWRAAPGLQADLMADTSSHRDDFPTGEAFTTTLGDGLDANPGAYTVAIDAPQRDDVTSSGVTGAVHWDRPYGVISSISAWRVAERRWAVDLDYSPADGLLLDYVDRYDRISQDLRLTSHASDAPFRWLVGLYAFRQTADAYRPLIAGDDIAMFVPPLNPEDRFIVEPDITTESYAVFGSVGYVLRPDLKLDVGLRLLTSQRELRFTQQSTAGYQSIGVLPINDARRRASEQALLPDLSLTWDLSPRLLAYARYARGSKSGGFDADVLGSARTDPTSFDEETVDSYEVGMKGRWFQQRLNASLSLFLAEYRDYQVSQFQPVGNNLVAPVMANAGKVRSYGPELELLAFPLPGLTLRNSTALLSSKYVDFPDGGGPGVDFSGNRAEYAPRWATHTTLEYQRSVLDVVAIGALSYSWRSGFSTQPSNLPAFEADVRRLLGARLGFTTGDDRLDVSLYADNLLDERYIETVNRGTLGTIYGRFGAPRSVGLQVQYRYD